MSEGNSKADMRLIGTRLDYVEKAIDKQEVSLEKRLESMNEFRQALKDQNQSFITRAEYDAKHIMLEDRAAAIEKIMYVGIGAAVVLELVIGLLVRFVK